jgi:hypothetical protein
LRVRKHRRKKEESDLPEKPRAPRARENSGKRHTIAHGTAPSLGIVAEEEKEKQPISSLDYGH